MTPTEAIIATTFPAVPVQAAILGDRVILHTQTCRDAAYIMQNCDALLPSLELTRAPKTVYLHCSEDNTYHNISYALMVMVSEMQTPER